MGGPAQSTLNAQNALAAQQTAQGAQNQAESAQVFNQSFPWLTQAGNYYQTLASGNPQALSTATAPVAENVAATTNAAENQIKTLTPRGGAQDTSIANLEANKVATIGQATNQAYTSAPAALAALSGQGLGLSINEMSNAIAGLGQASSTLGTVGNEQAAGKASTLGFIGALSGSAAEAAAAA